MANTTTSKKKTRKKATPIKKDTSPKPTPETTPTVEFRPAALVDAMKRAVDAHLNLKEMCEAAPEGMKLATLAGQLGRHAEWLAKKAETVEARHERFVAWSDRAGEREAKDREAFKKLMERREALEARLRERGIDPSSL